MQKRRSKFNIRKCKGISIRWSKRTCYKNIYYDVLPEEVIKYANQMDFPIFIFDKKGSYYEDIVTEIYDKNKKKIVLNIKKRKSRFY